MLELVKEVQSEHGVRKTYYNKDKKVFVKIFDWVNDEFYRSHIKIMKKYYRGVLVDHKKDDSSMQFTYIKIKGVNSKTVVNNNEMLTKLYYFVLKELNRTWPYYHSDWAVSNILYNEVTDKFYLIDWTTIEKGASKAECLSKINRDLREGFGEKLWANWIVTDEATKIMRGEYLV